jgi:hypothetical protein
MTTKQTCRDVCYAVAMRRRKADIKQSAIRKFDLFYPLWFATLGSLSVITKESPAGAGRKSTTEESLFHSKFFG